MSNQELLEPIDPSLYTRAPIMSLEAGIALARALVSACPPSAPSSVKKSAKKLNAATDKAQIALAKRQKIIGQIPEEASRLIDQDGDNSWGALRGRLYHFSLLPKNEYPDASRAAELVSSLFGDDGLSFLKEKYPVQWAVADTVLKRIDDEQLHNDINRIAGSEFLENVRKRHVEYGAMVQRLLTKGSGESVNLSHEVHALGRAIVAYATQICASADDDDSSPEMILMARCALKPLDNFRDQVASRANPSAPVQEPSPTPSAEPAEVK